MYVSMYVCMYVSVTLRNAIFSHATRNRMCTCASITAWECHSLRPELEPAKSRRLQRPTPTAGFLHVLHEAIYCVYVYLVM